MYDDFYGFSVPPFALAPNPALLVPTNVHERALIYLRYGAERGEGFVMLTGPIGVGKTLMLRAHLESLPSDRFCPVLIENSMLKPEELLAYLALELGVEPSGLQGADLAWRLRIRLGEILGSGRTPVIAIDDAQRMPVQSLEQICLLSNAQRGGRPLLQGILAGHPELVDVLSRPALAQLKQRVIAHCSIAPLGEADVDDYVIHRLGRAGSTQPPRFSAGALALIARASGGVPRVVNLLCDRALLAGYLARSRDLDEALVQDVVDDWRDEWR